MKIINILLMDFQSLLVIELQGEKTQINNVLIFYLCYY
jgi:hypothetical protein